MNQAVSTSSAIHQVHDAFGIVRFALDRSMLTISLSVVWYNGIASVRGDGQSKLHLPRFDPPCHVFLSDFSCAMPQNGPCFIGLIRKTIMPRARSAWPECGTCLFRSHHAWTCLRYIDDRMTWYRTDCFIFASLQQEHPENCIGNEIPTPATETFLVFK